MDVRMPSSRVAEFKNSATGRCDTFSSSVPMPMSSTNDGNNANKVGDRVIGLKKDKIVSYWPVAIFCDFCPYVFVRIKLNQGFVDMPKNLSMT